MCVCAAAGAGLLAAIRIKGVQGYLAHKKQPTKYLLAASIWAASQRRADGAPSLSLTHTNTPSLPLALSHTHSQTLTHALTRSHTHTLPPSMSRKQMPACGVDLGGVAEAFGWRPFSCCLPPPLPLTPVSRCGVWTHIKHQTPHRNTGVKTHIKHQTLMDTHQTPKQRRRGVQMAPPLPLPAPPAAPHSCFAGVRV